MHPAEISHSTVTRVLARQALTTETCRHPSNLGRLVPSWLPKPVAIGSICTHNQLRAVPLEFEANAQAFQYELGWGYESLVALQPTHVSKANHFDRSSTDLLDFPG
jgi:hypothetical protein